MNEKEVFKTLRRLNLPNDSFYVLGTSALVLYNVKKETKAIELCVSPTLFRWLTKEGKIDVNSKNKIGFYKFIGEPEVKVVVKNKKEFKCVDMGAFMLEDVRYILEFKKKTNFKKDKKDIEKINEFLFKYPKFPKFN